MFRRDPLDAVLSDIRSLLRANLTPLYPLLREVYARGGVLGVRHEGQTLLVGLKQIRSDEIFELASVTKPFTAALAGALVQAGRLEWTAPVARLGGPLRRLPASLTALTLATHTAGVPAHPFRTGLTALTHWHDPYAAMSEQAVLNSVKRWASANSVTKAGQPSRFLYSNLGAGALALALASAAGQPPSINGYGAALAQYVTQPLELPSITLMPPERHSTAYSLLGSTQATRFGPLAGAGGLYGTAQDLLNFGAAHLSGETGTHWQMMERPPGLPAQIHSVAPGWFRTGGAIWHGGVARGTRTALGFSPHSGTVITVLARGGLGWARRDVVTVLLLRLLESTNR
ncbi:serine hydrolase domain-containing protein [Deinococcus aquatilis]|jgi:CubicO group peptidase (beta-lactamase class C family)|uniref:serine hydrolase domain-containing protein n=1 Tax=Deinococcus aquatilis TaxID=519440 RepID=UPI000366F8C4|nr:serine hydrolase domain-containing protein [Deinococcus aquatilis]